jgi:hypothetical protein
MQVVFNHKDGRTSQMHRRYAVILKNLGKGTFSEVITPKTQPSEELEIELLRAEADERGIEYHHRTGPVKLRELLGR